MKTTTEVHPDYARNPADRWSSGGLEGLFTALTAAAKRTAGQWVKRVLRGGAWVGMRYRPDGLREIRFYRRDSHKTEAGADLWAQELAIFRRQMGLLDWTDAPSPEREGPIATYAEPLSLFPRRDDA